MHRDAEPGIDGGETLRRRQFGLFGFEIGDEGDYLGGDLVTAFGSPWTGHEAGEAGGGQRTLSLVESGSGDAEGGCNVGDRHALGIVAPDHFVADLNEVLGVKEGVSGEEGIADGFRMRIERPVARERLALGVALGWFGHARLTESS